MHAKSQALNLKNKAALEDLLTDVHDFSYALLLKRWRLQPCDAADIANEVAMKVYTQFHKYDPGQNFAAWVITVCHHHMVDSQRKRKAKKYSNMQLETDLFPKEESTTTLNSFSGGEDPQAIAMDNEFIEKFIEKKNYITSGRKAFDAKEIYEEKNFGEQRRENAQTVEAIMKLKKEGKTNLEICKALHLTEGRMSHLINKSRRLAKEPKEPDLSKYAKDAEPLYRDVILGEMPYQQFADEYHVPVGTVKSRVNALKGQLWEETCEMIREHYPQLWEKISSEMEDHKPTRGAER